MKTKHIVGTFLIILISIYFAAAGMIGSQNQLVTKNSTVENVVQTKVFEIALGSDDQLEQDSSIFSITTIISLLVAVIGIVAFRRNTYS